jgi:hypothetical protein
MKVSFFNSYLLFMLFNVKKLHFMYLNFFKKNKKMLLKTIIIIFLFIYLLDSKPKLKKQKVVSVSFPKKIL